MIVKKRGGTLTPPRTSQRQTDRYIYKGRILRFIMGSESKRLKILNQLRATFLNAKQGIDRNKLIIEICMQEGVTKKKADEYIQVLIDGEFIMEDEFGLWLKNGEPNKIDEEMELKADLARKNEDGETRIEE